MSAVTVPESLNITYSHEPAADAAGRTGDYISVKHANKVWAYFLINQGNAATVACSLVKATAVAGTGATAVTELLPIWSSQDLATTNVLTRATSDAASFTTSAAVKVKLVAFQIDPAVLGAYDCLACVTGASNAANITSSWFVVEPKVAGQALPNLMVD